MGISCRNDLQEEENGGVGGLWGDEEHGVSRGQGRCLTSSQLLTSVGALSSHLHAGEWCSVFRAKMIWCGRYSGRSRNWASGMRRAGKQEMDQAQWAGEKDTGLQVCLCDLVRVSSLSGAHSLLEIQGDQTRYSESSSRPDVLFSRVSGQHV